MAVAVDEDTLRAILSVVRLGDVDHRGWWRSHGLDETGSFLLRRSFRRTWAATAMELSMLSARVRHDEALGRADAVHIFSDELPFFRLAQSWLLERKLEDDVSPFDAFGSASTDGLLKRLPEPPDAERRARGLFLGSISRASLQDPDHQGATLDLLLGSYRALNVDFIAPYLDLSA